MLNRPLLTVHEAAGLLKVKESTVRSLINEKRLRAVKVGKEWRIAEGDLVRFLDENANRQPGDAPGDSARARGSTARAPRGSGSGSSSPGSPHSGSEE